MHQNLIIIRHYIQKYYKQTSSSIILGSRDLPEFASDLESSFLDSCLFQQSFLRWPVLLQYHHFNLLFLPFYLDLEVPLDFYPFSLDRPLTTKASGEEVSKLNLFLNSWENNAPTTLSNYKVSIVLILMEQNYLTTRFRSST